MKCTKPNSWNCPSQNDDRECNNISYCVWQEALVDAPAKIERNRFDSYFMDLADRTSLMSYCNRLKVGAIAVKNKRPLLSGWNGTPEGTDNCCEETVDGESVTKLDVSHAERNLIEHAAAEGISLRGSVMYVTHAPCIECAKSIKNAGITEVVYAKTYRSDSGLVYLNKYGVQTRKLT